MEPPIFFIEIRRLDLAQRGYLGRATTVKLLHETIRSGGH
jgi:hypothetical protein